MAISDDTFNGNKWEDFTEWDLVRFCFIVLFTRPN
jgi:hypothetical protein